MSEIIIRKVEDPEELKALFRLRHKIYCEELHWLDAANYPEGLEKDEYDKYSLHYGAFNGREAIGTIRLILENPQGLPIRDVMGGEEIISSDKGKTAEISRLLVGKADNLTKHNAITLALIKQVYFNGKYKSGVTDWFAAFDVYVHRLIKMIGFKFKPLGAPKIFMGSKTVPTHITTREADEYFLNHNKSFYDYLNSEKEIFFQG